MNNTFPPDSAPRAIPSQPPVPAARPAGWPGRLAWLPIPLLLVAMALLWVADLRGAYESASLLLVLNFVCSILASCFIAYLVARSFLVCATPGLLLLGCGVIAWGAAGMVGVAVGILAARGGQLDINLLITIHNLCVWLSAVCHLAGAVFFSFRPRRELRSPGLWLMAAYTLCLGAVALVTLSALTHWLPLFFVQGQGGTLVRLFVLGSATGMFVLSAALLGTRNRREMSLFVYWYTLALALIAVGLFGIMIESVHASLLSWTGRTAQFLGGAYMFIAAIVLGRQPGAERLTLAPGPSQARYRYAVAIAIVAASAALRLALFQSLGTRAVFITFYPAVMLAVLYGGFQSGLLATVLSAAVADYFWMEPVGHFSIKDTADGLSLAIFLLSGLMISWITDGTRRAQARTAQAETEARVAAERVRAAEARQQQDAELREAQHIAQLGSWHWDAKTDVTTGSEELLRIYGFDPASQAMPNFKEQRGQCYPVEDWERVNAAVQRSLETETGYELDVQAFRNGVPIWVTTRGELVRDADGQIAGLRGTVQDITERQRAEEGLRESESRAKVLQAVDAERRRFNDLLNLMPAYVILLSPDYRVPFANRFFEERFGRSNGKRCYEYLFGRTEPCETCETFNVLKTHASHEWEWLGPDGCNYEIHDFPFTDADGSPLIMEVGLDITGRKRAEAALKETNERLEERVAERMADLRQSEERLRLALEAADLGTWDLDLATGIAAHSLRHDQIFGYQEAQPEWTLEIALRHVLPEDRLTVQASHASPDRTGGFSIEVRVCHPDGSIHWVNSRGRFHYDSEGRPVRIIGIVADVSERKQAEEALRQRAEEAQRLGEEEFRSLAEAMPQIVWATRPDGWNIYFNQQWVDYTGMTMEESYGHGWNTPFHPDDKQRAWEAWQRATQHYERYSLECRLRRADGAYRWWLIRGEPMREANGEILKWFGTCTDIEEIKQAEAALQEANDLLEQRVAERTTELRESEHRFRLALKNAPVSVALQDRNLVYQWAYNQRTRRPDEIVGKTDADLFAPEDVPGILEVKRRVLESGTEAHVQHWLTSNGKRSFLDLYYEPTRDAAGKITGIGIAVVDLTEQKLAEEALRTSERLYRAIGESIDYGIWICDAEGRNIYASESLLKLVGITQEQCRDFGWGEVLHPDDAGATVAAWKQCVQTGGPWYREHRYRGMDGQWHPILACGVAVRDEQGQVTRWAGINLDIRRLKQAEEAVRQSELQFRTLADSMPNLAWWANGDGYITWYNRRWYEYTGTTPEQMEGWGWQSVHDPEMLPKVLEGWRASIATGEPFSMELPLRGADGGFRWFLTRVMPLRDGAKKVVRWFGTNTDVSDLREAREVLARNKEELERLVAERTAELRRYHDHLEELVKERTGELLRTTAELKRSNRELEQFAYAASHDLQEPLRAVSGYVQLLERRLPKKLDEKSRHYILGATDGATRMSQQIIDLLELSRVGTRGLRLKRTDLAAPLDIALGNLQFRVGESAARVTSDPLPTLVVDESQMIMLFQNLIGNALKFRSEGRPEIHVGARREGGRWVIGVRDNGIGIEPQYFERIFQVFQRLHTRDKYPGTGVGLALCRRVVERHGGQIWVESQAGQGATFYFSLPDGADGDWGQAG